MPRPRSRSEWRRPIGLPYWQTPTAKTILGRRRGVDCRVTVVPVPPDSGKAEREHILRDSGAQAWLGETDDHCEGLPVVPVRLHARSWHSYPEPAPQSTAFVLYTSGTTGPPKGVLLSRSAIAAGLDALAEAWDWTWRDTLVHGLPLFHVRGLILGILGPLRIGSRVIHTVKPTPGKLRKGQGLPLLRCPHRLVAYRRRRRSCPRVVRCPTSGSPVVRASRACLRKTAGANRIDAHRALRHERDDADPEHAFRRRATPGVGRRAAARSRDSSS